MKHQLNLLKFFPSEVYPEPWPNQLKALKKLSELDGGAIMELETGSGKTGIGITYLRAQAQHSRGHLFYLVPNKTLADQVKKQFSDLTIVYGRNEYPCLFYTDKEVTAEESPCFFLRACPHRVDQTTGETKEEGAKPCPYLLAKYQAKQAKIVVATFAFYLFTQLFSHEFENTEAVVIDEVHQLASAFRRCLSYEISDYHLAQGIEFLQQNKLKKEAVGLEHFLSTLKDIIDTKSKKQTTVLLTDGEIVSLLRCLSRIKVQDFEDKVKNLVASLSKTELAENLETIKRLERIVKSLYRYYSSLEYSRSTDERKALNYSYGYLEKDPEQSKSAYKLIIKGYHVAPLIKKVMPDNTLAYSATIGNPEMLYFETALKLPFYTFGSDFLVEKTRIFIPTDTPNLAVNERKTKDLNKAVRSIARSAKQLAAKGMRSLIVVVSNLEKDKMIRFTKEEGLDAVSYGNGVTPRQAAEKFKAGVGDCLIGTVSNYGEGVDLPKGIAPVIFYLRPAYPSPLDPASMFEEMRYGGRRWAIWNWRVMIEALQVRGRNIRSSTDIGVTFFISQQFKRFVRASLPEWLDKAYVSNKTLADCIVETIKLMKN